VIDLSQSAQEATPSLGVKLGFQCEFPRGITRVVERKWVQAKDDIVYIIEVTAVPSSVICDIDFSELVSETGGYDYETPSEGWEEVD
jgi:hypothetical protein